MSEYNLYLISNVSTNLSILALTCSKLSLLLREEINPPYAIVSNETTNISISVNDIPVHDTKPTNANDGDIIAVGGRKYKASLSSVQVPNWTKNYADPTNTTEWLHDTRLNSSNVTACTGMTTTNYIDTNNGDVVRVAGFNMEKSLVEGGDGAVSHYLQTNKATTNGRSLTRSSQYFISEVDGVYAFSGGDGYLRFCVLPQSPHHILWYSV